MKKIFFITSVLLLLCSVSFFWACQKEHEGQNTVHQTEQVLSDEEFDAKIVALETKLEAIRKNEASAREGGTGEASVGTAIIDIEAALNRGHGQAMLPASDVKSEAININITATNGILSEAAMQTIYNTAYNLWYATYTNYNAEEKHAIALDIEKVDSLSAGNQINIHIGAFVGETDNSSATNTPCISTFNESHYWSQKSQNWGLNTNCNPNLPAADKAINIELAKNVVVPPPSNCTYYYINIVSVGPFASKIGEWINSSIDPDYEKNRCIVLEKLNSHYCSVIEHFSWLIPMGNVPILRKIRAETILTMIDGAGFHKDYHACEQCVYGKVKKSCSAPRIPDVF